MKYGEKIPSARYNYIKNKGQPDYLQIDYVPCLELANTLNAAKFSGWVPAAIYSLQPNEKNEMEYSILLQRKLI